MHGFLHLQHGDISHLPFRFKPDGNPDYVLEDRELQISAPNAFLCMGDNVSSKLYVHDESTFQ
jgi:hypothetical protein